MKRVLIVGIVFVQLMIAEKSFSQIVLPQIVRDSMVLQRDATINVWGWASKGEKVSIIFNKKKVTTITTADGKWKIALPAMKAGGPHLCPGAGR